MSDLTGLNSRVMMTFPFAVSPIELEDFRIDQSLIVSSPELTKTDFSLRGKKYDSLIYNDRTITINFMATSPSISLFTIWQNLMFLQKTSLNSGILFVTIYNLGKRFVYTTCALRNNQQIPNIQATLGEVEIILSCDTNAQVITL